MSTHKRLRCTACLCQRLLRAVAIGVVAGLLSDTWIESLVVALALVAALLCTDSLAGAPHRRYGR